MKSRYPETYIGEKIAKWTVISDIFRNHKHHPYVKCQCECGTIQDIDFYMLRRGKTTQCRKCRYGETKFNVGEQYGGFLVIKVLDRRKYGGDAKQRFYLCKCTICDELVEKPYAILSGLPQSCGCIYKTSNTNASYEAAPYAVYIEYKRSAARRKIKFELSPEEFFTITKKPCLYCGIENSMKRRYAHSIFIGNGVDRIDNNEGYVINNCVPCCGTCNLAKGTKTMQEFATWVYNLTRNLIDKTSDTPFKLELTFHHQPY